MGDIDGFILIGGASSRMGADKAQLELGGQSFVERIAQALSSIADRVSVVGARQDAAQGLHKPDRQGRQKARGHPQKPDRRGGQLTRGQLQKPDRQGGQEARLGLRNLSYVPDLIPSWGALGGIHAALKASQADWAVIVACDLPFVTGELFARLWLLRQRQHSSSAGGSSPIADGARGPGSTRIPAGGSPASLSALLEPFDAVVPIQTDGRAQPLCALYRREPCLTKAEELITGGERRPRALLAAVQTRWVKPDELADLRGADYFFTNINTPADYARAKEILGQLSGKR